MNVRELRTILEHLQTMYAAAGAKTQAADIEKVMGMLKGHESSSVDKFVSETRALLSRVSRLDPGPAQQLDHEAADRYVSALLDAGTHQSKFDTVFAALQADKDVSRATLDAISNRYLNEPSGGAYVIKFKSRQDAIDTIRKKFVERAQSESKRGIIGRLTRR